MGISEVIAALALAVSLAALGISYSSYRHTVRVSEGQSLLAFSREKSEFLVRIDKARAELDRLGERLEGLLTALDHAPDRPQEHLSTEAGQVKSDLEYLEGCKRQVRSLYDETYETVVVKIPVAFFIPMPPDSSAGFPFPGSTIRRRSVTSSLCRDSSAAAVARGLGCRPRDAAPEWPHPVRYAARWA